MMKYIVLILSLFFSVAGFGQGQMFLRATAAASGNLLLDDYPGAKAAFSVRKLDNDYVGNCLRVRRESDNAEQDIGFSGNDIDNAALTSFCAATNCRVVTWYDQSGNGLDATQASTGKQPIIVSAGVIETSNGITAINFNVTRSDNLRYSHASISQPVTYSIIAQLNLSTNFRFLIDGNGTATQRHLLYNDGSSEWFIYAGVGQLSGITRTLNQSNHFVLFNNASSEYYVNGSGTMSLNAGTDASVGNTIGASYTGANGWTGYIQEVIAWDSNQSANRAAIETNTNNYFSIY